MADVEDQDREQDRSNRAMAFRLVHNNGGDVEAALNTARTVRDTMNEVIGHLEELDIPNKSVDGTDVM